MLLAGDIGGTKTVLALFSTAVSNAPLHPLHLQTFPSGQFASLEAIIAQFLEHKNEPIEAASFGVAGPVVNGRSQITNLPWVIDSAAIGQAHQIKKVILLNDLESIANAVPHLQPTDLAAINEIYNQAVRERFCTAHLIPVTMEQREAWYRSHESNRFPVFVATDAGNVIGWVSLSPYRPEREALEHVAEISYYVERDNRGRGIGRQLIQHGISVAPEFGFSVLVAILLSKNQASLRLLEISGFTRWGTMPGIAQIGDEVADHLFYGLKI